MSEKQNPKLEQTLKDVAPDKAASLLNQYQIVMNDLDLALSQPNVDSSKRTIAGQAKAQLDKITGQIIDAGSQQVSDSSLEMDKFFLVGALEQELTSVSDTLKIDLSKEDPEILIGFIDIQESLSSLHIYFPMADYLEAYASMPQEMKIPIKTISEGVAQLVQYTKSSDKLKSVLYANQFELITAIGHYCNGNLTEAENSVRRILDEFQKIERLDQFRKETGLDKLEDIQVGQILETLRANGLDYDKAVAAINEIKRLNSFDYKQLQSLPPVIVTDFILSSVLALKESPAGSLKFIKASMHAKATVAQIQHILDQEMQAETKELDGDKKEMEDYRKRLQEKKLALEGELEKAKDYDEKQRIIAKMEECDAVIDTKTANLDHNFKVAQVNLVRTQRSLLACSLIYEVAMDYIIKNEASLDSRKTQDGLKDILSYIKEARSVAISYTRITDLCTKYKLEVPATTNILIALEVQDDSLDIDAEVADYIDENFAPDYQRDADFYMSWYNDFLKEGKIGPKSATFLFKRLAFEEDKLITTVNVYNKARIEGDGFFYGLKNKEYKTIDDVPEGERDEARQKLFAYLKLREQLYSIESRLLGVYSGMDLLGKRVGKAAIDVAKEYGLIPADLDKTKEGQNEDLTVHESGTQELVEFLKVKDYKTPDREILAISPLHAPLLMPELNPIIAPLAKITADVAGKYKGLEMVGKRFEQYPDMPKSYRSYTSMWDLFTMGKKDFTDLLASISTSREKVGTLQTDVQAKLAAVKGDTHEIVKAHPELKGILEKMFGNLDTQLTWLLTNEQSPLSSKNEGLIKESQAKFNEQFDEFAEKEFWNIVKIAAIMVVVIGAAVAGGVGAVAIATHFGIGAGGGLVSTLAITGVTSLGGVVGSRVGMLAVDGVAYAAGADPVFGMDQIFDPGNFARDLALGWGLSFGAVSMARFVMFKSEAWSLGKAGLFKTQYAGKAGAIRQAIGRGVLDKAKILQTIADPSKWFAGGKAATQQAALKHAGFEFGERYVKENLQEYVESAGDAINPVLGFFLSVANSSDGINIELSRAGFDPQSMGLKVEDGALSYTTATAQEFVANVEAKFRTSGVNSDFTTSVNPDGTVVVDVTPKTAKGELDYAHAVKVEVKPANTGLSPDVEMARAKQKFGLEQQSDGTYSVADPNNTLSLVESLKAQGFTFTKTENGFKAVKGSFEMEVTVDPALKVEFEQVMAGYEQTMEDLNGLADIKDDQEFVFSFQAAIARLGNVVANLGRLGAPLKKGAAGVAALLAGCATDLSKLGPAGEVVVQGTVDRSVDIANILGGGLEGLGVGATIYLSILLIAGGKTLGRGLAYTARSGGIPLLTSGKKIAGRLEAALARLKAHPMTPASNDVRLNQQKSELQNVLTAAGSNIAKMKKGEFKIGPFKEPVEAIEESITEILALYGRASVLGYTWSTADQASFDAQMIRLRDATTDLSTKINDTDLERPVNGVAVKKAHIIGLSALVFFVAAGALRRLLFGGSSGKATVTPLPSGGLPVPAGGSTISPAGGGLPGGGLGPQGGLQGPQGGTVGPQGGTVGPQGGTVGPQGGTVGPQGGTVGPQGGLQGPQGGTVGPQGGTVGPQGGGNTTVVPTHKPTGVQGPEL